MRILDIYGNELTNPDLKLGYLKADRVLVRHHEAVLPRKAVIERRITKFPNGGIDIDPVVISPAIPGKDAWDEYEDIRRYILHNASEQEKNSNAGEGGSEIPLWWSDIKYFTRKEFRCPCGKCDGYPVEPQEALVREMEAMREHFGKAVIVVPPDGHSGGSGVRCKAYNASLSGSVPNSKHLQGKAADFSIPGAAASAIEAYLNRARSEDRIGYWYKITTGSYHMELI